MDHQECLKSIFLKTTVLHFDSSNTKVFLSLCSERWQKFHFITLNQFQTMEAKRSWDCVQKPLHSTPLLTTIFWSALGSSYHPPTLPPALLWPEKDSFPSMVLKIQLCLGWEGEGSLVLLILLERSRHFWPLLLVLWIGAITKWCNTKDTKNTCCGSILSLVQILFSFVSDRLIIIYYHTQKQREIKFKPRTKWNHNIPTPQHKSKQTIWFLLHQGTTGQSQKKITVLWIMWYSVIYVQV